MFGLLFAISTSAAEPDWRTVAWHTITEEPQHNMKGKPIISGGMPIGNGETTALVFPVGKAFNTSATFGLGAGVHIRLGMMTAMASDMAPMELGIVSIITDPPLGDVGFLQELYLHNATVEVSTSVGSVLVWVDASSNRVTAQVSGDFRDVSVLVSSLRPAERFAYGGRCSKPTSAPDVFSVPAGPGSLGLSHRNDDSDIALLDKPAAFNSTLDQQGLSSLSDELQPMDAWRNLTFGFVVSSDALVAKPGRRDFLQGKARAAVGEWSTREIVITTLARQSPSQAAWERAASELHTSHRRLDAAQARGEHVASWASFWERSHIWVSGETAAGDANRAARTLSASLDRSLSREAAVRALRALMPQDALLSLDASTLTLADGARVAKWPDTGSQGHDASQPDPSRQPIFRAAGAVGGRPAVVFDGATTFLANKDMPLPSQSTIVAVFQDHGTANDCCTGVFYSGGGCNGLSTQHASFDNDPNASVLLIDWSGSTDTGTDDVKNRQIVASVVYNASGAFSFADGCLQSQTGSQVGAAGKSFMIGSRNDEMGRFFNGTISEILVYARPLNATELAAVHTYLLTKWPAGSPLRCRGLGDELLELTRRYAQTRYVQAIQAGTWVPIKFNGMAFTSQLPPETTSSGPTYRDWGSCNWWQNTRLAYWNMLAPADFDSLETILEYFRRMLPLLERRTPLAFNHSGIYITETSTLFGLYDPCDYGKSAAERTPADVPFGYEESRWTRFDFGGDGGLPELCMMLLDHYLYTLDDTMMAKYLPLLSGTLDFFARHYNYSAADGKLRIFPTQALETYQCPNWPATEADCPLNDHPTVAALHVLTERALELPTSLTSAAQRTQWAALRASLPELPMVFEEGRTVVAPYEGYPKNGITTGNVETPELYSTHPFRLLTLAASRSRGVDIAPSIYCLEQSSRSTCRYSDDNEGWTQGLINAALLGRASRAASKVLERSKTKPAIGYRFPAFMDHMQDYQPSEDHLANLNTALQFMLLSPADDGLEAGGVLLFPAWPCSWDVDFRLAAPRKTYVSGALVNGTLVRLDVDPPERKGAVTVLPCQP